MTLFATCVLFFQYFISAFNSDLHYLLDDLVELESYGMFGRDDAGRIIAAGEREAYKKTHVHPELTFSSDMKNLHNFSSRDMDRMLEAQIAEAVEDAVEEDTIFVRQTINLFDLEAAELQGLYFKEGVAFTEEDLKHI